MNETIEGMKAAISIGGEIVEMMLNAASVLFILLGLVFSLKTAVQYRQNFPGDHPLHTRFRMSFGGWLVVALEFQLAADIVGTIISPTTAHLVELGAIALIRTFLNYFLNKELLEQRELSQQALNRKKQEG
ncbi:MAG TPA: DUF1622 domain-containing protein [Flavisolibacter sp.]|nr:DUF1622 domain-containing protein [Flavisolibacter sp.]